MTKVPGRSVVEFCVQKDGFQNLKIWKCRYVTKKSLEIQIQNFTANTPRTTCTFLVRKLASVPELKERLGFGVCSYMPLGVVWLEEQPGDNIFFWISTVFSVATLENWKSNWKWEHESTFAARSPCVLRCSTIWAYLRDRHDQAVQNHCSNLNLATVNGFNI